MTGMALCWSCAVVVYFAEIPQAVQHQPSASCAKLYRQHALDFVHNQLLASATSRFLVLHSITCMYYACVHLEQAGSLRLKEG
jgi:hypothetical protein